MDKDKKSLNVTSVTFENECSDNLIEKCITEPFQQMTGRTELSSKILNVFFSQERSLQVKRGRLDFSG